MQIKINYLTSALEGVDTLPMVAERTIVAPNGTSAQDAVNQYMHRIGLNMAYVNSFFKI